MKTKYYLISTMLILGLITLIIPTIYYVITGNGFMTLQEKAMKKYYPELYNKPSRRSFWQAW